MEKRRILILISTLEIGGVEMDLLRNIPKISRDSFEMLVFPFVFPGALAPEMVQQGVRVIGYSPGQAEALVKRKRARWKTWLERCLGQSIYQGLVMCFCTTRQIFRVARVIRSERVSAVHCFLPNAYFVGVMAALISNCHYRLMSRVSLNFYMEKHRVLGWLERNFLHRFVTRAIGNSKVILDELRDEGVSPGKLVLLYNGIDFSRYADARKRRDAVRRGYGLPSSRILITLVGNLHGYKGHQDFLEALLQVRDKIPDGWEVWIAGRDESGNLERYVSWCEENDLGKKVIFLGARSDIPDILSASDIHVHPSHHEGLPNSILEAMAAGLPVIATAVGGIPELITDEENGLLVAPHAPTALAGALIRLLGDAAARERMGHLAASRVAAHFSIEASVRGYEKLYREVLSDLS